jgi:hypothetical protein
MFDTIMARGFSPRATAIAARTIGGCYQACFYPDARPLIGLAIVSVTPEGAGFACHAEALALRDDELPGVLLDWLEARLPEDGVLLSWDHWWPLPARLEALAGERHPRLRAAAADSDERWRDLPRSMTWHLRHAPAASMPCLCGPTPAEACRPRLPAVLLPDPAVTEQTLIDEALRGWTSWARLFADFDDAAHPANVALAAARDWTVPQVRNPG